MNTRWIAGLIVAVSLPFAACGPMDDGMNNNPDPNNETENNQVSEAQTVRGALTAEAAGEAEIEGNEITAHTVAEDGSTTDVTGMSGQTDADGRYTLELTEDLEAGTTVIVEAMRDGEALGRAWFEISEDGAESFDAPPITVDSTAETNVTLQARVSGEICTQCVTGDLEQRIDSELAASIEAAGDANSDVYAEAATSIYSGLEARNEMLMESSTEADFTAAANAASDAYADLQASLASAETAEEREAAQETYAQAYAEAFTDAGFDDAQLALGSHAEVIAQSNYAVDSDQDVDGAIYARLESFRAHYVTTAVEATFAAHAAGTTEVEDAGTTLRADIAAAAESGNDLRGDVETAWADYHDSVRTEIESELSLIGEGLLGSLDESLNTSIGVFASAVAELDSSADAEATAESTVNAIVDLRESTTSESNVTALTQAGVEADAAEAYLEILFHLRLASGVSSS